MKVFAEVLPPTLGRAMHRVNAQLKRYAPMGVEFVSDPVEADWQWMDVIGAGSRQYFYKPPEETIFFFYCFNSMDGSREFWTETLRRAKLILSYYPLDEWMGPYFRFNFMRTPLGVDTDLFQVISDVPRHGGLTTGYVAEMEYIEAFYRAMHILGEPTVHLGANFAFGPDFYVSEGVSDKQLVEMYNTVLYCNGMRACEGFELSNIEGLLCGARPICLDYPMYRDWFEPWSIFVPESFDLVEMTNNIVKAIVAYGDPSVGEDEQAAVRARFNEARVYGQIWERILECV